MTGQNSRRTTRQGVSQWLGHDHRNLSTSIDVSGVVHYRGMTSSTDPSELTDLRKTVETFWATAERLAVRSTDASLRNALGTLSALSGAIAKSPTTRVSPVLAPAAGRVVAGQA